MIVKIALFCILLFPPSLVAKYKVLGIGSPRIDYIQTVDDELLEELAISKGGRKAYHTLAFEKIITKIGTEAKLFPGGSACTTMRGLAQLGIETAITGNLSKDAHGAHLLQVIETLGITSLCTHNNQLTPLVASLVTPDGEQTYCTAHDLGSELSPRDLHQKFFDDVEIVHVEGYRIPNNVYVETAMEMAKTAGAQITLDLCNAAICEKFRERILALINNYVDVLFINEKESHALTHLEIAKAYQFLKNYCDTIVIKGGKKGCWVGTQETISHFPALPAEKIDPTGAGALFTSGFIYGMLNHAPLDQCAYYGHLLGSTSIQYYGADIPEEKWALLREKMK